MARVAESGDGDPARRWTSRRYVVVDVEGNGQSPPDLVEAAAVSIVDGVIGTPTTWLVRPPRPITWQARRVHGITDADVADAATVEDLRDDLVAQLTGTVIVGHNVGIDLGVLRRSLPGWEPDSTIDTLRLARRLLPELPSHKLGALVDHLGLTGVLAPHGAAHRAGYDVLATAHVFTDLANRAEFDSSTSRELPNPPGLGPHPASTVGADNPLF